MAFEAILDEVDQLHNVSTRLEGLAEQHVPITEALMTIAGKTPTPEKVPKSRECKRKGMSRQQFRRALL